MSGGWPATATQQPAGRAVTRENAQIDVLITLNEPMKPMLAEAAGALSSRFSAMSARAGETDETRTLPGTTIAKHVECCNWCNIAHLQAGEARVA